MPPNPASSRVFKDTVVFISVQKPVTWMFGTHTERGRCIEIDISYLCNLTCHNCNRS
jgi:hypothetical protein